MSLTKSFPGITSSAPDFLKLSPYEVRRDSIDLLKAGKIEDFNAAQRAARAEKPDFTLNLSRAGVLPDAKTAWALLLEQVYGPKGVTQANMAYMSYPPAWHNLHGIAHDRGVKLREDLLEALHAQNQEPAPVNLSWTNIEGADLSATDLREADFRWTMAGEADFTGADLRGSKFAFADLRDADFTGANIEGVDFSGADLSGARGLTVEMLARASLDEKTILPNEPERSLTRKLDAMNHEQKVAELRRVWQRTPDVDVKDSEPTPSI